MAVSELAKKMCSRVGGTVVVNGVAYRILACHADGTSTIVPCHFVDRNGRFECESADATRYRFLNEWLLIGEELAETGAFAPV